MQQPMYRINDLACKRGGQTVLSIINFEIHRGIIYAVAGQSGAGKSTLLELLARHRRPSKGTLLYDENPIGHPDVQKKFAQEVCFLAQVPTKTWRTVKRYMLRNIRTAEWSQDTPAERLKMITQRMNLGNKLSRPVRTLSPGERRWVDLAIQLACDAKVLIIDEIEQHLSYDEFDTIRRLLQRKCNLEGTTVILSTLNLNAVRRIAVISVTLDRGRIAMIRSSRTGSGSGGGRTRRSGGPAGRGNFHQKAERSASNSKGRDNPS